MYASYYGFSDRPFQLTPDARFYFESRTHKKAMAYLGYGLAQGEGFIVITGEIGAGKSTLVAHLMATVDRERLNVINLVSTQIGADDVLRLAAQGMGLTTENASKAQLLDQVERYLQDQAGRGKRTLLIVDEAQNLSVPALEELRMLSNFQSQGRALLQIFLLGQPEFRDKLANEQGLEQLRQRVIATHHLAPMEANEVEPYIIHRLMIVDWKGRPLFLAEAFESIYRHSEGVPRRVNQLVTRLLLFASVEQLDSIDARAVGDVVRDMAGDAVNRAPEPPLPLRSIPGGAPALHIEPRPAREPAASDNAGDRIAALEARIEEQEVALRRVLTLLVDWVEGGQQAAGTRSNAA